MLSDREFLELAEKAGKGEREALGTLAGALRPLVCRWALVITGDPDDAEDVAQIVLMKTLGSLQRFDGRSKFTSWVYRIARNASLDHQRRKRRDRRLMDRLAAPAALEAPPMEDPLDEIEMKRTLQLIRALLGKLSTRQREVFDLVDLQGLGPGEAARLLDMNPNTLRVQLLRARRAMRREMLARGRGYGGREEG